MQTPADAASRRLFVLARHAESTANAGRVLSSDPARPVNLTAEGRRQARRLGHEVANLEIGLAVATRSLRTQQTARIALEGRSVPLLVEPLLDEIDVGTFDGAPIETYWTWLAHHPAEQRLPGGESVTEALARYAAGLRSLLARAERVVLVVAHEHALRHVLSAGAHHDGSPPDADLANAVPYLFDQPALERAVAGLDAAARSSRPLPRS